MARFDLDSVSLAQKPKSAGITLATRSSQIQEVLTNFDVTTGIKEHVVTLDVAMDDALLMQMLETTASLE